MTLQSLDIEMFAKDVMSGICADSRGGSINRHGDTPLTGYMVGGKTWTLTTIPENLDFYAVVDFITAHKVALSWETVYVGWWTHEGRIYLDVSDNVQDRDAAITLAQTRSEVAYYDVKAGLAWFAKGKTCL